MMNICRAVFGCLEEWTKYCLEKMDESELPWCDCRLGKELFAGQFSCCTQWKFMMMMMVRLMLVRIAEEQEPLLKQLMVRQPAVLKK